MVISGGVGIAKNLYVGGDINTDQTTINLVNTLATTVNFAGAGTTINIGASTGTTSVNNNLVVKGNLTVQGTSTIVDSTVTNITDPIITIGGLANNAAPTLDDNKDRGIAFKWHNGVSARVGFFGYQDSTGFFTFVNSATIANEVVTGTKGAMDAHLAGGATGSVVYQSAANTTAFLANASTSGYVLTSVAGGAPIWSASSGGSGGSAGSATTSTNLGGGGPGMIPYQIATSSTGFISTGTTGTVLVSKGTGSPIFQNTLTLAGTSASISTTTGALQVVGGVGVGGNIYTGNRVGFVNTSNVSVVYQYYNTATNSLDTVFG